jgi:hypothetical protein
MAPCIAQLVLSGSLLLREEVIRDESLSEYVERYKNSYLELSELPKTRQDTVLNESDIHKETVSMADIYTSCVSDSIGQVVTGILLVYPKKL